MAVQIDDVAAFRRAGLQALDDVRVMSLRHEADVLAVVLVGDGQLEFARQLARLCLCQLAERKAEQFKLLAGRAEQEIALVAILVARAEEPTAAAGQDARRDVVTRRQNLRTEFARGVQEIVKFDRHVAVDAGDRRLAFDIALRETVDHRFLEAALVIEHVMRDADAVGNIARIVNILPRAAGALAVLGRRAVVVKLQRNADHVVTFGLEQRSRH